MEESSRDSEYSDTTVDLLGLSKSRSSELRNEMCKPFPGCLRVLGAADGQAPRQMAGSPPPQAATEGEASKQGVASVRAGALAQRGEDLNEVMLCWHGT